MTDIITIPLNKLSLWDGNVRKTGAREGIEELAASIAAHGLLQSLVVRKGKRGKYDIVAGQRRYLALSMLAKQGIIAKDHPVNSKLADDAIHASELSLAENVMRAPMHPADQFEAYRDLIDNGASVADVAARFGVTETVVARRLRLGRLSPVILQAHRNGEIDLEEAQAFAITDDHDAQERVFGELSEWNRNADAIRRALTCEEVPTSDKRVRFVGVEAYREAGGLIRQDLFCDEGTGYLLDSTLLDRLVAEKLQAEAAHVAAEGWRWVETMPDADCQALSRFQRRYPERGELPRKLQKEHDHLTAEYDGLVDVDDDDAGDRLSEIQARLDELAAQSEAWTPETLAIAGVVISLDYKGDVRIERGLVRKEDAKAEARARSHNAPSDDDAVAPASALSPRLVEDLTAHMTAAIGAELIGNPDMALVAVVHAMALDACYRGYGTESCLCLSLRAPSLKSAMAQPDACKGLAAIEQERESVGEILPGNPADVWDWCLARSRDELLRVLAFCASTAINAMQGKSDRRDAPRLCHADRLAQALRLDMSVWFTPTAENYFGRINRAQILSVIDEAKGEHAPALEKLKKAELASRAERHIAGTAWLPQPLRLDHAPVVHVDDEADVDDLPMAAQ